jgi:membrane-anchored protein YejM (alkaline phosphatase superfamily)
MPSGLSSDNTDKKNTSKPPRSADKTSSLPDWFTTKDRIQLLRWSAGYFVLGTLLLVVVALRYLTAYSIPHEILAIIYTFSAFTSHFASITLIVWVLLVLPVTLLLPYKKIIVPLCVLIISTIISLVLLDSQIFTSHRFHFNLLTIRILGWKTWGFGIVYMFIFLFFNSFLARIAWDRYIIRKKRLFAIFSTIVTILLLVFTHAAHIWADATGYISITRFTTTLPLFYPSTDKKLMIKYGFADISTRRNLPQNLPTNGKDLKYPVNSLNYNISNEIKNVVIIGVDDMRSDALTPELTPQILKHAQSSAVQFTNHWSGGNSTKMGLFSLFYGIPPTYEQYMETNKRSPVLIDKFVSDKFATGIFTSYRLYAPACLDITAFVKIPNLRLETKIPGPQEPYRNDSAITVEWKEWLDKKPQTQPFFGFLFYDVLSVEGYPPSYANRVHLEDNMTRQQKKHANYKVGVQYIDSLVGIVLDDLEKRDLMKNTVVIITSDHGEEYDDNKLGFTGHGSSFSDFQLRVPLIVFWPGKSAGKIDKRTSHYDIVPTIMKDVLGCTNPESDYSSGSNLFSQKQWDWMISGSYFNFAIVEPQKLTIQYPGGYYEMRDRNYQIIPAKSISPNLSFALGEMERFYKR